MKCRNKPLLTSRTEPANMLKPSLSTCMGKVLVIENDPHLAKELASNLRKNNYAPLLASTGDEGLWLFRVENPDVVVVNLVLPGNKDGFHVCWDIRRESDIPIITIADMPLEEDRIRILQLGADHVLLKPLNMTELLLKIRNTLGRYLRGRHVVRDVICSGDFTIDIRAYSVVVRGKRVHLTPTQFRLLQILANSPGQPFSRIELLSLMLGGKPIQVDDNSDSSVDVHVHRIRKKIEINPSIPQHLVSVKGVGYMFVFEPSVEAVS